MIEPEMMSSAELQSAQFAIEKNLKGFTKFFDNALRPNLSCDAVCRHDAYVVSQKDLIQKISSELEKRIVRHPRPMRCG